MIKVKAIAVGTYHEGNRQIGDEFFLLPTKVVRDEKEVTLTPEEQFNPRWMVKIEEPKAEEPKA